MVKRIFIAAMLAALTGALALFIWIFSRDNNKPEAEPSPTEAPYILPPGEGREIIRVSVENESGGYTLVRAPEGEFFIEGFEDIPLDRYALSLMVGRLERLRTQDIVESPPDLGVFGLAAPKARAVLGLADGTGLVLYIGAEAPDGRNRYIMKEGDSVIHLVSLIDTGDCFRGALDFADTAITFPVESQAALVFDTITLGGRVRRTEPVTIVYDRELLENDSGGGLLANPYRITHPVEAAVSLDRGLPVLEGIFNIQADRVVARTGRDFSPADFGLSDPYAAITVSGIPGDGGSFSLSASAPNEQGLVYLQRDDSSLVYEIDRSKLSWLEITFFDLMERLVILPFIDSVASVELRGDSLVSFTLSGKGDDLAVAAGDTVIDTARFRTFYQTLLTAAYDDYYDKPLQKGAVPVLEIIYRYRDGRTPDTVAFYPAASRRVLTSLNGRRPFYTHAAYVDKVVADCERILADQGVLPYL
jgi:hypothetical protein